VLKVLDTLCLTEEMTSPFVSGMGRICFIPMLELNRHRVENDIDISRR